MNCKLVVGQKVVCVDDKNYGRESFVLGDGYAHGLRKGSVYTVRYIEPCLFEEEVCFLHLSEINEGVWNHNRFAPVIEKKTDISIFQEMLTKTPATIDT